MKKKILFPYDSRLDVDIKVDKIEDLVGRNNIDRGNLMNRNPPGIVVRCNKKQWKEIKFMLDLEKIYM